MIPVLETERLRLREWRESDLAAYAQFAMDPAASKYVSGAKSVGEAWRKMVYYIGHWQLRGFGLWSVEEKFSKAPIGYCGPYYPYEWPEPEIGWGIYPAHQRNGFATEAARAALAFAYTTLGWKTAISVVADENKPSFSLAQKLGAVPESAIRIHDIPCTIFRHLSPHAHSKELKQWQ